MIKILRQERLCRSIADINEDVATVFGFSKWVLDASSGLTGQRHTPGPSDGAWFVQQWDEFLRRTVSDYARSLADIVREGIAEVGQEYMRIAKAGTIDRVDVPSASVAIMRFNESAYDYFLLGDCTLILSQDGDTKVVADKRVSHLDAKVVSEMTRLQCQSGFTRAEAFQQVRPMLLKHRRCKNQPDGYWVLGLEPEAVSHAETGLEPTLQTGRCLLMTDGFAQGWDTFGLANSAHSWLAHVQEHGLTEVYTKMQQLAEADRSCTRFPRLKTLDDASAILTVFDA